MAVNADLNDIRLKVRRLTGMLSPNHMSDNELDNYINSFYEYDLPKHLKLLNLKMDYKIILEPGVDLYTIDTDTYQTVQPPFYVAGYDTKFYQDKQVFYQIYPEMKSFETLAVGNGGAGPYAGNITGVPIIRRSVFISTVDIGGTALSCNDDGNGGLTGDAFGAVDYVTGAVALTWSNAIPAATPIYVQYNAYQAARPQSVLLTNGNQLIVRPIPDLSYELVMVAFVKPTALVAGADFPEIKDWWQLIAYGAALKIFADNLDMENYARVDGLFDKQLCLVERRTLKQLSTQRANTIFAEYEYSARYSQFL